MTRVECLEALLDQSQPIGVITSLLRTFEWDSDKELVILARQHVRDVLARFSAAIISANDVGDWADAIEVRDDVGLEAGFEDLLKDTLFELANQEINGPLTRDRASEIVSRLLIDPESTSATH